MLAHINGTEIYYEKIGKGIPIMVMHGGLGFDHTYFQPWLEALANKATLIFFDHRGNGLSDRPDSFDGITHQTWVEDADALRKYLGYDRIVLMGHSYGGYLAQDYALRFGQNLLGLVLCSTALVIDYQDVILENARKRSTPEQFETIKRVFSQPIADDEKMREDWLTVLPIYFKGSNAMYDPALGTMMDAHTVYNAAAFNHGNFVTLPEFNALPRLGEIQVPTLVITGIDDWVTPVAQGGKRIHDAIPNSQLVVFEQSGHWPFIEEKAYFRQVLTDWLDQFVSIPLPCDQETPKPQSNSVTPIYYPKTLVVPRSELTEIDPTAVGGEILEGDVRIFIRLDYVKDNISGGIFESTKGKARVVFPFTEHATFFRGRVRITDVATCTEQLLKPGDSYIIEQGTTVIWETITPTAQKSFLNITTP